VQDKTNWKHFHLTCSLYQPHIPRTSPSDVNADLELGNLPERGDIRATVSSLFQLNLSEDVQDAATEAMEVYNWLEGRGSSTPNSDLAHSLQKLSFKLSGVSRREEALKVIQKAVDIRRELVADHPADFRPDFASSLHDLSYALSRVDRRDEALKAIQEAVDIRRELVADRPAEFGPDFASSLHNLSYATCPKSVAEMKH
jgi:tetratricopeptide (TPR) repeat protein